MIPIAANVPAGSERGVAALLDLIINPKRAPEAKAILDELVQVRDAADEAVRKANTLHMETTKRSKELDAREAALNAVDDAFQIASRNLAAAEKKHSFAVAAFERESSLKSEDLSARAIAVASAEQALAGEREALRIREAAIGPKELAAAALKAEYEKKLAELRKLTGQL